MKTRLNTENFAISIILRVASWIFLSVTFAHGPLVSAGTLAFSAGSYSVAENGSNLTITVNRTGSTVAAASVTVASENGSAGASDFTAVSQALTWGIGDSAAKTFTVAITDDGIYEGNESFSLKFTGATGDGTGAATVVTITDYEEGKLQFSSTAFIGQEDSLQVIATISRISGTNGSATVKIKSSVATTAAASNAADYTDLDLTVTFADGQSSMNVPVLLKNDNVAELSEFFILTLSDPTNATLGSIISATAEIQDADSDFTSTLKLLTKEVENISQTQLVDLSQNSILDTDKKILDLLNTIPILALTELEVKQDSDGLMTIDIENDRVYLRPIAIKRSQVGSAPNINVGDDINSTFSTSQGWFLETTPALANAGLSVLQKELAAIFLPDLVIADNGNITIQVDQGAPPFERDALNNVVVNYEFYDRWNLRPSMVSTVTTTAGDGYLLVKHPMDKDEVVMAVTYTDGGIKRQQILSSAPINGSDLMQELKTNGLNRCAFNPGVGCKVSLKNPQQLDYGIIKFDFENTLASGEKQTIQITLFSDYQIRKTPNFTSSMVGFTEVNDINKDTFADYKMIYPNGEEQYFFLVTSIVK
jgi:hypothetical protein